MLEYAYTLVTNINPKYVMKWISAGTAVVALYILYDINSHDDVFLNKE